MQSRCRQQQGHSYRGAVTRFAFGTHALLLHHHNATSNTVHTPLNSTNTMHTGAMLANTNTAGEEVHAPFKALLPMVSPDDFVIGGWDISGLNMAEAMERARVLDFELQKQLVPYMKDIVPLPGIYDPAFIAANQNDRADNVLKGSRAQQLDTVRRNIRELKAAHSLDKVVVLWTANTERYAQVGGGREC